MLLDGEPDAANRLATVVANEFAWANENINKLLHAIGSIKLLQNHTGNDIQAIAFYNRKTYNALISFRIERDAIYPSQDFPLGGYASNHARGGHRHNKLAVLVVKIDFVRG